MAKSISQYKKHLINYYLVSCLYKRWRTVGKTFCHIIPVYWGNKTGNIQGAGLWGTAADWKGRGIPEKVYS